MIKTYSFFVQKVFDKGTRPPILEECLSQKEDGGTRIQLIVTRVDIAY